MLKCLFLLVAAGSLLALSALSALAEDASALRDGTGWTLTKVDIDVTPIFSTKKVTVHGRAWLRLDTAQSYGPTLRLGHDLTPYFSIPTQFMYFMGVNAGRGSTSNINRQSDKPGLLFADVRFPHPKHRGAMIALDFDVVELGPSFTFVVTDKLAFGASGTGWYPRPILPAGQSWPDQIDNASGVTRIHLPTGWHSLSTGAFEGSESEAGGAVESWRKEAALPRARAFVVGPYTVAHRTAGAKDVWIYSLTSAMEPDKLAPEVAQIISVLSADYGPYPFSKYAAAEFPDDAVLWWGDAEGDLQVLRKSLLDASNGGFYPLAHEIGHAWWGNTVEPKWPGGYMLTEAMAGYSSLLALEAVFGKERYRKALYVPEPGAPPDYTMTNHFKIIADGKDTALSKLEDNGNDYQISLVKGTFFYHMLRQRVGDDVFFSVLKKFVAAHQHRLASLDELRADFSAAASDKGLPEFFEQWLDRTGAPVIEAKLSCKKNASGQIDNTVSLTQTQKGDPYKLPLLVRLKAGVVQNDIAVDMDGGAASAQVTSDVCYLAAELDPNHDLFIWRPEYGADAAKGN